MARGPDRRAKLLLLFIIIYYYYYYYLIIIIINPFIRISSSFLIPGISKN